MTALNGKTLHELGDRLEGFQRIPSVVFVREELYRLASRLGYKPPRKTSKRKPSKRKPTTPKRSASKEGDDLVTEL